MNSQVALNESNHRFGEAVLKIRRRDNVLFFVSVISFGFIITATSTAMYRWIKATDYRIDNYKLRIDKGNEEIAALRSQIAEQQKKLDAYAATVASYQSSVKAFQSDMDAISKGPLNYLTGFSLDQRKDIDSLQKKVDCLIRSQQRSACK